MSLNRSYRLRKALLWAPLLFSWKTLAVSESTFVGELVDVFGKIFELPTTSEPDTVSSGNVTLGNTTQAVTGTGTAAPATVDASYTPLVIAHHIVGNTYNYSVSNWATDISLAAAKGVDAFALNVGVDSWEPGQIANAYKAAQNYGSTFKLFLSFDMGSLPCTTSSNSALLRNYITTYENHPNQMKFNGSVFASTFAGESCKFGASTVNQGWINTLKTNLTPVYFVPSFFVDPATLNTYTVMDGAFNWNSGWPMGNYDTNFTTDQTYLNNLGNRSYMGAVSPWFFTHYGPKSYNKNFIYRGDDWLFAERWELLIANRNKVPFAQVISWNDYGESHYIGPVQGVQPMSQSWVNGFDHQGWLDLMQYYISAFKTGSYPTVTKDKIFLWGRLYPAAATSKDPVAKPTNWQWTQDYVWGVFLLTSPAQVQITCGTASTRASLPAGLSKISLGLTAACSVSASIMRGANTNTFAPKNYNFNLKPPSNNFNAFVAAST
ncbi:glycoside hydrolase family 71 protein [Cristinia sonorae]|uniref:Glycoside hydrolase family 71 protein n=1 Tax=Cristinia sonorae TaxID=1940300 RepID=A0A8K0ULK1_9AGAR|nr:glycoside hydrolase family 71 protein [Cristinia sonorae]